MPSAMPRIAVNIVAWLAGLAVYHVALRLDSPVGATLPSMAVSAAVAALGAAVKPPRLPS